MGQFSIPTWQRRRSQRNSRFTLIERIAVCPLAFHAMVGSRRKELKQMLEFIIGLVIGAGAMYAAFKFGYLKL